MPSGAHQFCKLCGYGPCLKKTHLPARSDRGAFWWSNQHVEKDVEKTRLKVQEICWTCAWEYTFYGLEKVDIFFLCLLCVTLKEWLALFTHIMNRLWKRHGGIGVVNFLCLVQDLFLTQKLAASHLKTRASEDPITSHGTGKAFYTFYTYGRCSARQFRLADVPRRSP